MSRILGKCFFASVAFLGALTSCSGSDSIKNRDKSMPLSSNWMPENDDRFVFATHRYVSWAKEGDRPLELKTLNNLLTRDLVVGKCQVVSGQYSESEVKEGFPWDPNIFMKSQFALEIESSLNETIAIKAFVTPGSRVSSYESNDLILKAQDPAVQKKFGSSAQVLIYSGSADSNWTVQYERLEIVLVDGQVRALSIVKTPTQWQGIPFVVGEHVPQSEKAIVVNCE